jgi:hypothetical protein
VHAAATPLPADSDADASPPLPLKKARTAPLTPATPAGRRGTAAAPPPPAPRTPRERVTGGRERPPPRPGSRRLLLRLLVPILLPVLAVFAAATFGIGGGSLAYIHRHPEAVAALQRHAGAAAAALRARADALRPHADALAARGRQAAWDAADALERLKAAAGDKYADAVAPHVEALVATVRGLASGGKTGGGGGGAPAAAAVAAAWDAAEIAALLPKGAGWEELAADVAERLRRGSDGAGHAAGAGRKGVGLLLACAARADCDRAADALPGLKGVPPGCVLKLDGGDYSSDAASPAAMLQAALAVFLKRCPAGLVVLQDAQMLALEALPALHSALSELGGFQHGGPVDASRGVYVLVTHVPSASDARRAARGEPGAADAWLKELFFEGQLGADLDARDDQENTQAVLGPMLRALRRRIDFAAPLRLGPESEAGADQEDVWSGAGEGGGGDGDDGEGFAEAGSEWSEATQEEWDNAAGSEGGEP